MMDINQHQDMLQLKCWKPKSTDWSSKLILKGKREVNHASTARFLSCVLFEDNELHDINK